MKIRKADWLKIFSLILIFIGGLMISYHILKPEPRLPVYNPSQLDRRLVDESVQNKGRGHTTLPFSLVNQNGDSITDTDVKDKIIIADFFFTTCPGICKDMAAQKRRLQQSIKDENDVVILSHSVMPEVDSVEVLKQYAELQGAIDGKWHLLTGDKPQIYRLARQSYFAVLDEGGEGNEKDFIHTESFVLIDKNQRIRGFYDGTSAEDVDKLLADLSILQQAN